MPSFVNVGHLSYIEAKWYKEKHPYFNNTETIYILLKHIFVLP